MGSPHIPRELSRPLQVDTGIRGGYIMALRYLDTVDALNVASTNTLPELTDQSPVIVRDGSAVAQIKSVMSKVDDMGNPYVEIQLEGNAND